MQRRRTLQWVAGSAAAAVVLGGVAFGIVTSRADADAPPAAAPTSSASAAPSAGSDEPGAAGPAEPAPPTEPAAPAEEQPADPAGETVPAEGVVHVEDFSEAAPVALDQPSDPGDKAVVSLTGITRVDGVGRAIGERGGPALAIGITIRNDSGAPLDLNYVVVNVYSASGVPSVELSSDPHVAGYAGVLAPGESADATYVFRAPAEEGPVKVTVSHDAAVPAAAFQGEITP